MMQNLALGGLLRSISVSIDQGSLEHSHFLKVFLHSLTVIQLVEKESNADFVYSLSGGLYGWVHHYPDLYFDCEFWESVESEGGEKEELRRGQSYLDVNEDID